MFPGRLFSISRTFALTVAGTAGLTAGLAPTSASAQEAPSAPPSSSSAPRPPASATAPSAPPAGAAPAAPEGRAPLLPTPSGAAGARGSGVAPAGAGAPGTGLTPSGGLGTVGTAPRGTFESDASRAEQVQAPRPPDGGVPQDPSEVFSEDWWARARPVVELHGYFRTRGELLHNFSLGRREAPGPALGWSSNGLWARPLDDSYVQSDNVGRLVVLCRDGSNPRNCEDQSQATANMRLRLQPELILSDNLRVMAQIDALDNLVLGSTPEAYAMQPAAGGNGYAPALGGYYPWSQIGFFSQTQGPPTAGINSFRNSVDVKRAWAEYATPLGQVRFGRMPLHWGLGMLYNAGDGLDSDWQTTVDRIMFLSGIKSADLYFGGSWDFPNSGVTSANPYDFGGGSPYNLANLTNVGQWTLLAARKRNIDLQRLELSRGDVVINGGAIASLRIQTLDVPGGQTPITNPYNTAPSNNGLERRNGLMMTPDAWVQVLWRKLRIEAEFAAQIGQVDLPGITEAVQIRQYGLTSQIEYRAVEDKLRLQMGFGWASGDPWVEGLNPNYGTLQSPLNGRGPSTTFRMHPDYRVDLIFFRRILSRVEGAYYFRPSVDYDFIRKADGQKLGGGAAVIWSRSSEFVQAPGNARDLGVELNLQLYYQAKDGSLNDDLDKTGGFFAMLQYGAFFPLGGLQYMRGEKTAGSNWDVSTAQTVRLFLGVSY